jgi:hypothetical protein
VNGDDAYRKLGSEYPHPMGRSLADWIRITEVRFRRPKPDVRNQQCGNALRFSTPPDSHPIPTDTCQNDPDLAAVVEAWARLPEAIRAGIMAMVKAASK